MAKKGVNLSAMARSAQAMSAMSQKTSKIAAEVEEKVQEAERRPGEALQLPLADIVIRKQVRADANVQLDDLIELIQNAGGVLTPIVVIPYEGGKWLLVAGERRVRASMRLGLETIPANVAYGVSEVAVRVYQVQENSGRVDLSTMDVVLGVIDDYKEGGYERAQSVWGHSQSWLSKRIAFDGYRDEIKALLFQGKTEDLELLGSLEGLSKTPGAERQYQRFMERLARGEKVGRDEVRLSHQSFKLRAVETSEDQGVSSDVGSDGGARGASNDEQIAQDAQDRHPALPDAATDGDGLVDKTSARLEIQGSGGRESRTNSTPAKDAAERGSGLDEARSALYNRANGLKPIIDRLRKEVKSAQLTSEDEEWVMWCAFVDVVSPALALLGPVRSNQALRALMADLKKGKGRGIADIMDAIHRQGDIVVPSPERPEHWVVMTDPVGKSD